ncbi:hypothetical protein FLONG3_487 [Fusarium longipes]|uniref:Uncharacterized protein n=1 Tax=Fusarium longipes TaxID=694270 RepID=A0A395T9I1_9HYPO|nr:hypothetical protein FLONG3_487 [Fusarium longipes]
MFFSTRTLTAIAAGVMTLPSIAYAQCLAIRTFQHSRPLMNDVLTMEFWYEGKKVCHQRAAEFFADNEDYYQWDCDDLVVPEYKWRIQARENGKQVHAQEINGAGEVTIDYEMTLQNTETWTMCGVWGEPDCELEDTYFESCSWTSDLCLEGVQTCSLCDGKATCDVPP